MGRVNCALGEVKMEVWWVSEVFLVIISNQKQFQKLRMQDEQNNELKAWIN